MARGFNMPRGRNGHKGGPRPKAKKRNVKKSFENAFHSKQIVFDWGWNLSIIKCNDRRCQLYLFGTHFNAYQ